MSKLNVRVFYPLFLVAVVSLWGLSTTVFAQQQDVLTLAIPSTSNQSELVIMTSVQQGAPFPVYISFTASTRQGVQTLMQTGSQDGALPSSLTMPALDAGETWSELLAGYGPTVGSADYRYCYEAGGNQICFSTITVTYSAPSTPVEDIDSISSQWRYVTSNQVAGNGCSPGEEITRSGILSQDGNRYSGMFPDFAGGSTYTGVVDGSSYILGTMIEDFLGGGGTYVQVGESRYANNELRGSAQWWWTDTAGYLCWGSFDIVYTALRDGDDHSNTTVTATVVALDTSVPGAIDYSDDIDYFSIEITTPTDIVIYTTGNSGTVGGLYDSSSGIVATNDDFGGFRIHARVDVGVYYLGVTHYSSSGTGSYILHVGDRNDDHGYTSAAATTVLSLYTSVPGTIDYPGDDDYFSIEITTPTSIVLFTTGDVGYTIGTLRDSRGTRWYVDANYSGVGSNFLIRTQSLDVGTYHLEVNADFGNTGAYTLHIVTDDHGNTTNAATVVALDTRVPGTIDYPGDVDYFSIGITNPTNIDLFITGDMDTTPRLTLMDNHGIVVGADFLISTRLETGTYYLDVENDFGTTGAYTLHIFTDDHGSTTNAATVVALDTSMSGAIDYPGDADYFSIGITTPTDIVIYTTGNSDTVGGLYDSSGSQLEHNDDYLNRNFQIHARLPAGVYYIRVTYFESGTGPYILHVMDGNDDHGYTSAAATVLRLDTSVPGTIDYPGDVDYFSIEITTLAVIALFTTGEVDNTIGTLRDSRGTRWYVDANYSGVGSNFLIRTPLDAGTYYLEVEADSDNTGAYRLHAVVEERGDMGLITGIETNRIYHKVYEPQEGGTLTQYASDIDCTSCSKLRAYVLSEGTGDFSDANTCRVSNDDVCMQTPDGVEVGDESKWSVLLPLGYSVIEWTATDSLDNGNRALQRERVYIAPAVEIAGARLDIVAGGGLDAMTTLVYVHDDEELLQVYAKEFGATTAVLALGSSPGDVVGGSFSIIERNTPSFTISAEVNDDPTTAVISSDFTDYSNEIDNVIFGYVPTPFYALQNQMEVSVADVTVMFRASTVVEIKDSNGETTTTYVSGSTYTVFVNGRSLDRDVAVTQTVTLYFRTTELEIMSTVTFDSFGNPEEVNVSPFDSPEDFDVSQPNVRLRVEVEWSGDGDKLLAEFLGETDNTGAVIPVKPRDSSGSGSIDLWWLMILLLSVTSTFWLERRRGL